jgi:hypothetical protein
MKVRMRRERLHHLYHVAIIRYIPSQGRTHTEIMAVGIQRSWRYAYRGHGGTHTEVMAVRIQRSWRYTYRGHGGTHTEVIAVRIHKSWQYAYG